MKKIFITILFLLSSFSLMAETLPQAETPQEYTMPRNSISVGFGGSTGTMDVDGLKVDTKSNLNISYLQRLKAFNGKLAIGADFTTFFGSKTKYTEDFSGFSVQNANAKSGDRNRVFVDSNTCSDWNSVSPGICDSSNGNMSSVPSCSLVLMSSYCDATTPSPEFSGGGNGGGNGGPDVCDIMPELCGGNGGSGISAIEYTGNSYTLMLLADYAVYSNEKFDVSAQLGAGMVIRTLSISGQMFGYSMDDNGFGAAAAYKAGVVGTYNITNNLGIGAGVHYVYTGETTMVFTDGDDSTIKSNGAVNYNLHLRLRF
ncbi:MAG: hypothetical protein LBQ34_04095 [Alphaproteobacteria bacterium]|jgi:hypothetical protein|nr:hypothetical protein [Alphaproteobacteria bacterium]